MVKNNQYRIVGCIIRAFRLSRGIDQAEYAKQIGTSQSWVSRIESGHRFMWLDQLDVVSRPFGVDNPAFCSFILECFREYGQKENQPFGSTVARIGQGKSVHRSQRA